MKQQKPSDVNQLGAANETLSLKSKRNYLAILHKKQNAVVFETKILKAWIFIKVRFFINF